VAGQSLFIKYLIIRRLRLPLVIFSENKSKFSTVKKQKMNDLIKFVEAENAARRAELPEFSAGDTINVHVKIREGAKERVQVFQGTVIQRRNAGAGETFTVRKISNGIGVERIFPLLSPNVDKIEVLRKGKVRRARLFYLRGKQGRAAKVKELIKKKVK
jgi:large subunit ribosomal protein L19